MHNSDHAGFGKINPSGTGAETWEMISALKSLSHERKAWFV